jgi:hypothetical protein
MPEITVRIAGTCCFVDTGTGKRLVLPHDNLETGDKQHIGYVEFPDAHIVQGKEFLSADYNHESTGQIRYRRFELTGHVITIANVSGGDVVVKDSFKTHVPSMTKINPNLYPRPRSECFDSPPPPALICGVFDITSGILLSGPLYEFITVYENSQKEFDRRQTPKDVSLILPVTDVLSVTFSDSGTPRTIVLDNMTDLITIGNQPIDDILGLGSGDDITHHFRLYYNMATPGTVGNDPALPRKLLDPVNSCTVTGWP